MKTIIFLILFSISVSAQNSNYQRSWGTYFGDERFYLQDSKTDKLGNLYIVGVFLNGTSISQPVFSTSNSYQSNFGGGEADGFITKFNSQGQLTWSTYFGGTETDTISGIDIDSENNIYILGATSSTNNISTANASQVNLNGNSDFFIARFTPNGTLTWSTYYGGASDDALSLNFLSSGASDTRLLISHDKVNNFYIAGYSFDSNLGTAGTFQQNQGISNQLIAKFNNNGVNIWTTYYGSINRSYMKAIHANSNALYIRGYVASCDPGSPIPNNENYYGTTNSHQPAAQGCISTYLSKFTIDGQREWSTYYGASNVVGANSIRTYQDNIYISGDGSGGLIATPSTFQQNSLGEVPPYLVQFNNNCTRNWGTFCGSNVGFPTIGGSGSLSNVNIDDFGKIYLSGTTPLHTNISTSNAYQNTLNGQYNGFICKFNNLGQKEWGTYYGGNLRENTMIALPYDNNFYVVGQTISTTGLTTTNCYQSNLETYDIDNGTPQNIFIAHFEPTPLSVQDFDQQSISIYPNPFQEFVFLENFNQSKISDVSIYDVKGQKVFSEKQNFQKLDLSNLSDGFYLMKIITDSEIFMEKLLKIKNNF